MEAVRLAVDVSEDFRQALREYALAKGKTMGEIVEGVLSDTADTFSVGEFADWLTRVKDRREKPKRK